MKEPINKITMPGYYCPSCKSMNIYRGPERRFDFDRRVWIYRYWHSFRSWCEYIVDADYTKVDRMVKGEK